MHRIFEFQIQIRPTDIDVMGHVNNVTYVRWMQDAAVRHSAANGWPFDRYVDLGAAFVARKHSIEYLSPAFEQDSLTIRTWVSLMKKVSSSRKYQILRDHTEVIATGETRWAFIALQSGVPTRIPNSVTDCFQIVED